MGSGGVVKELLGLDAVEAAILMFPPPPTRTDPPAAEGRAMFNAAAVEAVILMFPLPTTRTDPLTAEGRAMFMLESEDVWASMPGDHPDPLTLTSATWIIHMLQIHPINILETHCESSFH